MDQASQEKQGDKEDKVGSSNQGNPNQDALAASNQDCQSPAGVCPCKGDISLVPVRYAIDDRPANKGDAQPHPLPKNLHFSAPLSLKGNAYTLRQLRDGWLYVYNETSKELDEYEIKGAEFIHASKGAKGHVIYPRSVTLSLSYSPQVWSERIKAKMCDPKTGKGLRSKWMRQLSLPAFVSNQVAPHGATIDKLESVVDMSDDNQAFALSCTPLTKNADEDLQGEVRLLSHKAANSPSLYKQNMPDPESAMLIALRDPFAEVADLSMAVNSLLAQQDKLLEQDSDDAKKSIHHKLMMAEITRSLARVQVDKQDLPAAVRGDAAKTYEFETVLDEYLGYRNLEQIETMTEEGAVRGIRSTLGKQADELQKKLATEYGFNPNSAQEKAWSQHSRFQNEVDWKALNDFVARYQAPLADLSEQLSLAHQDLSIAIDSLEKDPLPLGVDNEQVKGQGYLSLLFAEVAQALSLSCQDDASAKKMATQASTPNNFLALGPYGFDATLFDNLVKETELPWLTGSSGDMAAFWGRFADLETLIGDEHIQQKQWYKASVAVLNAIREASLELAKGAREWLLAAVLPYSNIKNLSTTLRLILLESVLGEAPLKSAEAKPYREKLQKFSNGILMANKKHPSPALSNGGYQSKTHQNTQSILHQQAMLEATLNQEPLIQLKSDIYNKAGRGFIRNYLGKVINGLQSGKRELFTALNSNNKVPNMGSVGGLVTLINLWNLLVVMQATGQNINAVGKTRALVQLGSAFCWAGNAVMALYQGQAWAALQVQKTHNYDLITKLPISDATKQSSEIVVKTIKRFTWRMLAFSSFGFIAAVVEAWDIYKASQDPLLDDFERLLMQAKGWVLIGQGIVFGTQLARLLFSHFGAASISAIFATWMLSALFVLGVAYLLLTVLINIFKTTELERWLKQSTWGTQPNAHWSTEQELQELESIIHKPAARVVLKESPSRLGWANAPYEHYLEIDLPGYLQGQSFNIHLSGHPKLTTGSAAGIRSVADVERLTASMKPYEPTLNGGRWQGSRFSLWLGPLNSEYRLALSYAGQYGGLLTFSGTASQGNMTMNAGNASGLRMTELFVGTTKG